MTTSNGSHAKWIIGVVSSAIIALLGFFAIENYRLVTSRFETQSVALTGLMSASASRDERIARLEANQQHILDALRRIEDKQDTLLRRAR